MARLARVVAPGIPHHVTQRGNRGLKTFFGNEDYQTYLALMAENCASAGVEVWAYCLMPNHVHLILVPQDPDGLRRALGEAHRQYTRRVNLREQCIGHLWQERFRSFPMEDAHVLDAARYVELNPLRARLVRRLERWRWSSARAHLDGCDDTLVKVAPLLEQVPDWKNFLDGGLDDESLNTIRRHVRTGRPLGSDGFLERLEAQLDRPLKPGRRGPKPLRNIKRR
jgi:putative transposase